MPHAHDRSAPPASHGAPFWLHCHLHLSAPLPTSCFQPARGDYFSHRFHVGGVANTGNAQNQIDLILSKGPFDPKNNKIPTVLTLGTTTTPNVFVYRDSVSGSAVVTGTMTTTITDPAYTMTFAGTTADLNLRRATVTVSYRFRNTDYAVKMDTLRTADL